MPQKRKRPEPKPSWGPKSARKPTPSNTPKSTHKSLAAFAKEEDTKEAPSPKVSDVTKSKLALYTANDTVLLWFHL